MGTALGNPNQQAPLTVGTSDRPVNRRSGWGGGGCKIKGSLPSRVGEARRSHAGTAADRDGQVAPPCCPPSGHQRRVGDRRPIAESRGFRRRQGGNKELCPEVLGALLRSLAAFPRLRSLVNTLMETEGGRWAESWRYGSKATTG